jgi:hypothetical protein
MGICAERDTDFGMGRYWVVNEEGGEMRRYIRLILEALQDFREKCECVE